MNPPEPGAPPSAAFFDFDRTLVDGDAGVLFGAELVRIRWRRVLDEGRGTLAWALRVLGFVLGFLWILLQSLVLRTLHRLFLVKRSTLVRRAYATMRGLKLDDVRLLARDYFDEVIVTRLYPDAVQEMSWHRREGRRVIVITTNMHLLIGHVRRHAPVDEVIAVDFDTLGGRLTGTVHGPLWGEDKAAAVRDYAHAHDLSLPRSFAYTDHHSDMHLLHIVGHPIIVNPTWRLHWTAWRRGWPVRLWRHAKPK